MGRNDWNGEKFSLYHEERDEIIEVVLYDDS